jgi:peptide/nickel transport system permease protein
VIVTLGTSALVNLIPGSPATLILGENATSAAIDALNAQYGFNRPFWERYWDWVRDALGGSLGNSIQSRRPVVQVLTSHLPVTLEIAILTITISLLIAVPLALICAARADGPLDKAVTAVASALQSIPTFVASVVLSYVLSNRLRLLPTFGWTPLTHDLIGNLRHAAMAVCVLVLTITPLFIRVLRTDLASILREDYVLAAMAKGMTDRYIMVRHVLRPACVSLLTLSGLVFGVLIGGSVIVENVFALPGIGQAVATAVSGKDLPVVQGAVIVMALTFLVLNAIVDAGVAIVDPQVRRRT